MKPAVVCQPLGKFVSHLIHTQCLSLCFFFNGGTNKGFGVFVGEHKRSGEGKLRWMKLWHRGKEVLIKEVFNLIYI